KQLEEWVGVRPARLQVQRDSKVLAQDFREILRGLYQVEGCVDVHVLQLINQEYRRIAIKGQVAGSYLDLQRFIGGITDLLHDLATLGTIFLHIRAIARQ